MKCPKCNSLNIKRRFPQLTIMELVIGIPAMLLAFHYEIAALWIILAAAVICFAIVFIDDITYKCVDCGERFITTKLTTH